MNTEKTRKKTRRGNTAFAFFRVHSVAVKFARHDPRLNILGDRMDDFVELLHDRWAFLFIGYFFTIAIETPILCVGLSSQHPMSRRILAGIWLTACTYPIVILVVPAWIDLATHYAEYLLVAESTAHFGECALFYAAFAPLKEPWRDLAVVFFANFASFGIGLLVVKALGA